MENIKKLQTYINISNTCYKLNLEEILDESDEIFNLGTNI